MKNNQTQQENINKLMSSYGFVVDTKYPQNFEHFQSALNEAYQAGAQAMVESVNAEMTILKEEARVGEFWVNDGTAMQNRIQKAWDRILSSLTNPDMSEGK